MALTTDILGLPVATSVSGTEYSPIVQGGTTKRVAVGLFMVGSATGSVQDANTVLAGPASGAAAAPTFRTLTSADFTGVVWSVAQGGTGLSSYTIGDLMYASGTTTLARLADVATGNALISGGVGTAPAWGKIGLATHVSGTLPVASGGTGAASATAYAVVCGGATSTGPYQSVASVGTVGQALVSNGADALPTFQSLPAAIGQALTRTDDTNVTLTLGGSPTTALLAATSITAGWSGQLSLARGGTAANLTASTGGIVYSGAGALAILSGTATAGQIIRSGASAAPTWSTSTYPATSAAGTILTSATANTISATATPTLGVAGSVIGTLAFAGNTSGTATITPQATAGTPTLTLPNATGTFAVGATAPLVLSATTGNLTITSSALTKTDDTNVTLTLGGSPTTALLAATSITAGWTGQLSLTRGGTNASLTASNGGIVYSTASAMGILSGTATANQVLLSGSSTTPAWSTATYPASTTINQLLYSSSANTIAGLATTNGGMLNASSSGVPSMTVTPTLGVQQTTRGQLILANTAAGAFPTTIQSSNSASAAWTLTLPTTAGTSTQVLQTDGAGVTTWATLSGTGTVTSVASGFGLTGGPITGTGTVSISSSAPPAGMTTAITLGIAASVSGNALTIAIKDQSGSDPSSSSPVLIPFRSATAATGTVSWLAVTAATSLVISSGSTLGVANSVVSGITQTPFNVWVVGFNDAGTFRLGAIKCAIPTSSTVSIYALSAYGIASSTAEGGAGAADSAQVFYTGTAVTSKAYTVLGVLKFESGLATAGTWASGPTIIDVWGPWVPLPGRPTGNVAQTIKTDTFTSATTAAYTDITGFNVAIVPTSATNCMRVSGAWNNIADGASVAMTRFVRGSTAIGVGDAASSRTQATSTIFRTTDALSVNLNAFTAYDFPSATSSTTYKVQFWLQLGATYYLNRTILDSDAAQAPRLASEIMVEELMG